MGYVSDNLEWDEKIEFAACITPAIFIRMALSFTFALLAVVWLLGAFYSRFAVAGLLWPLLLGATALLFVLYFVHTLQALVDMVTTEFAITNKRLLAKKGSGEQTRACDPAEPRRERGGEAGTARHVP